jgi:signal transduction histidine kinase
MAPTEAKREGAEGVADLAGLDSPDPLAVAAAVRSIGARLRGGQIDVDFLIAISARLTELAGDSNARIRQSVADVAPYLPEPTFQALVPALAKDRSPYVRDAAARSLARRTTLRREQAVAEEHDARVERWYRELSTPGARAIARRIAAHETEYFVRRMCHEAGSSFLAYSATMQTLRGALEAPTLDRPALRALVERIDERFRFFQHVLETGRGNARPVEAEIRRLDVGAIVADEVELLPSRFADRAERILVDASGLERPLAIDGDEGFLRQALGNVLKNAVEAYGARHEGAIRIEVAARAGASDATVTIRDWGSGMTDHDVARAFVPFESSKPGGTGFGLFIARRVAVAVHGGSLTLASRLGEGTTVTMTLPLRHEQPRAKAKAKGKGRR